MAPHTARERIQYLFALKRLLDDNIRDLAKTITRECGKTLAEAEGELRRGIENVEVACGIPTLMMGANVEDIARGIDEFMIRQPVGVVAIITPFNFPGMIPLWFLPYAIACGNCAIVKPSEKTPVTMARFFELLEATHLPAGVLNLVHGGREAVDALLDHPGVRAVSFVGSSPVARHVYSRAAAASGQARAVPGRREESHRRPPRRGHGDDDEDRGGLGVRLRRPALPRDVGGHRGRRRGARVSRDDLRRRGVAARRQRPGRGHRDGAGDHAGEQAAHPGAACGRRP